MKHLKLFEAFTDAGCVNGAALRNLKVSEDDIQKVKDICEDIAKKVGDQGTCVINGGLLANGKTIVYPYSQGNTGPEKCYTEVKKYLEPKYPDIKIPDRLGQHGLTDHQNYARRLENLIHFSLFEGLSHRLFHFCRIETAIQILRDDRFVLAIGRGTPADDKMNAGRLYYLSFTRSPHAELGYARVHSGTGTVRIEIDGQKLQSRVKGGPVNYWNRPRFSMDHLSHMSPADKFHRLMTDNEMEDRIYSDDRYIRSVSKMIIRVDVNLSQEWRELNAQILRHAEELEGLCKSAGITLNFYGTQKDFASRKNPISRPPVTDGENDEWRRTYLPKYTTKYLAWTALYDDKSKKLALDFASEIGTQDLVLELMSSVKGHLVYGGRMMERDYELSLEAELHNDRAYINDLNARAVDLFLKTMKRAGTKTVGEYVQVISRKIRDRVLS